MRNTKLPVLFSLILTCVFAGPTFGQQRVLGWLPGSDESVRLDPEAGLPCVVSLVEPTGSETHVVAHSRQTEIVAVLRERTTIQEGETVRLSLDASLAHFFDPGSGRRLSLN